MRCTGTGKNLYQSLETWVLVNCVQQASSEGTNSCCRLAHFQDQTLPVCLDIWEDIVLPVLIYWCQRYLHSCHIACAGMQSSKEAAAFGSNQQYVHLNTLLLFRILAESPAFGSLRGYCTEDIFLYLVTPDFLINISVVLSAHFIFCIPYFHMCTSVDGIMCRSPMNADLQLLSWYPLFFQFQLQGICWLICP